MKSKKPKFELLNKHGMPEKPEDILRAWRDNNKNRVARQKKADAKNIEKTET